MKTYIKTILIGSLSLGITACSSFLDEKPYSDITNENWSEGGKDQATEYTKGEQMEQLLTSAYKDFGNEFWQLDLYIMNESQSDNAYAGEDKEQTRQFDELRVSPTNGGIKRDWAYLFGQISKANTIIAWTPKIKDPNFNDKRQKEVEAEARAMRAIDYFYLVRLYENVPLIIDEIPEISVDNIDEVYPLLYPAQATKEVVYTQILEDLSFALENIPDYSDNKFKITKALVNFITAEVYATKDGFQNADWNKVKEHASKVVNDSRYRLLDKYDDLFAVEKEAEDGILPSSNLLNEHSKESLFEVDYTSWNTLGNWGAQMFFGVDWKKFNTPSHDLVNAFNKENDEVRKKASIKFGDVTGKWTDKYWASNNYPYCFKMRAQEAANIIIYRYAEAILLLADAENEMGNISAAQKLVNQIRSRVNLPNTKANSKEELRLAIENEYRLEFAFEGKRWLDLKRRNRFIQVMKSCSDHQSDYGYRLNEQKLIWPIPQSELELNENLKQNPGY